MDIILEKKTSTEGFIKITLKEVDYQHQVEEKIKEYSKKAQVKGFRAGKVPITYIKKLYGKSILVEEINQILSKSLTDYIKDNKINILGEPLPEVEQTSNIDWDTQKEFDFSYNIGMIEEFEYDLSPKVKITAYDIEVDNTTITKTTDDLKIQYGTMTNPESSEEGDSLYGSLKQVDGEIDQDILLELNSIDKKARKNFIGLKKGDTLKFDLRKTVKDTHTLSHLLNKSEEEAAAIKGDFELTVKNVNRKVPAEFGQDFYNKIFGEGVVESEKEFIEKVKSTISSNYEKESETFLDISIRDKFVEKTKLNLPDEFLKKWLVTSNEGKVTKEDIEKEYDMYVKDLKWDIIKNKIREDNDIKVEHEDVIAKTKELIRQQFAYSGLGNQMEDSMDLFVDNYLKGENGNNYYKVFNQAQNEKVISFIKEKVSIDHKKVDLEKFKKLVKN